MVPYGTTPSRGDEYYTPAGTKTRMANLRLVLDARAAMLLACIGTVVSAGALLTGSATPSRTVVQVPGMNVHSYRAKYFLNFF